MQKTLKNYSKEEYKFFSEMIANSGKLKIKAAYRRLISNSARKYPVLGDDIDEIKHLLSNISNLTRLKIDNGPQIRVVIIVLDGNLNVKINAICTRLKLDLGSSHTIYTSLAYSKFEDLARLIQLAVSRLYESMLFNPKLAV